MAGDDLVRQACVAVLPPALGEPVLLLSLEERESRMSAQIAESGFLSPAGGETNRGVAGADDLCGSPGHSLSRSACEKKWRLVRSIRIGR